MKDGWRHPEELRGRVLQVPAPVLRTEHMRKNGRDFYRVDLIGTNSDEVAVSTRLTGSEYRQFRDLVDVTAGDIAVIRGIFRATTRSRERSRWIKEW